MGQSLTTTFMQLPVDVSSVRVDSIHVRFGNADWATYFGSAGSRSLFMVGSVVRGAPERNLVESHDLAA